MKSAVTPGSAGLPATLHVEVCGAGLPLVMLHGYGLDHTVLAPWHDELADLARVVYLDLRGHGRSERGGDLSHATLHADIAGVLDALAAPRAVIYGHSYGAWLAMGFAARYPARVAGLVLCGTAPAFDYVDDVAAAAHARDPVAAATLVSGLAQGVASDAELATVWRRILPLYFHGAPHPAVFARTQFSAAGFMALAAVLPGLSYLDVIPTLAAPMLVLAGRHDFITPPAQARRLAALAPDATLVELAGSGHFPFIEEPGAYLDAIRAWWPRVSRP